MYFSLHFPLIHSYIKVWKHSLLVILLIFEWIFYLLYLELIRIAILWICWHLQITHKVKNFVKLSMISRVSIYTLNTIYILCSKFIHSSKILLDYLLCATYSAGGRRYWGIVSYEVEWILSFFIDPTINFQF